MVPIARGAFRRYRCGMALRTTLTELLGIHVPVLNAPMTPQAGGALAATVARAGGFGMLGFDEDEPAESIREQIAIVHGAGIEHFGIGLVAWVLERRPELLDLAVEARPQLVAISFGDPAPYVRRLHDAKILVASQVQSRERAQSALAAGVDILVAQGAEAGGHTGSVATLPLLQIVLEMSDRPVIAAGGIVSGRGLAAVLAAGACGGWMGTPFLLAAESRTTPKAQARIIESDETQTIYTSVFDRVQHKGWTEEFRGRALRNEFVERWNGREDELMRTPDAVETFFEAKRRTDYRVANIYAGQSVGALHRVEPTQSIVERIAHDAQARLRACAGIVI
jgi:nitronate monooxygenase